jgi:hypothetical protein
MLAAKNLGFDEYVQILTAVIIASGLRFWAMAINLHLPKRIG